MTVVAAPPRRSLAFVNGFVDDDGDLVLLHRDAAGNLLARRQRAEYSFFLRTAEVPKHVAAAVRGVSEVVGLREEPNGWTRVRCAGPEERKKVLAFLNQESVEHFEGDVHPARRFMSDSAATIVRPRMVYLDIETDSRKTFADARAGKARVLCWCIEDEQGRTARGVLEGTADDAPEALDDAEARLLEALWRALEPYDCVLAWNGDQFDFDVIAKRTRLLGVRHKDRRRYAWLDQLELFRRMIKNASKSGAEKRSFKLEDVGQEFCKRGKTETPPEVVARWGNRPLGALTWELWAAGGTFRELMVHYCADDVALLPAIEKKTGFVGLFLGVCAVCRLFPDTLATNPTVQVDGFLLALAAQHGQHFATKKWAPRDENADDEAGFEGALILEPKVRGIGRDIHVCDFAGMYPSIMMTWNMSPETKARDVPVNGPIPPNRCRSPSTRIGFATDVRGLLCYALERIGEMRAEFTALAAQLPPGSPEQLDAKRKSDAMKVIRNSFYGVIGSPFSRYFDVHIAESTTQNGKWLITHTMHAAEARGWNVVWGHTDSLFVHGPSDDEFRAFVAWCNTDLYPQLVRECGCVNNYIELTYEKKFERLVIATKGRYVGWFAHFKGNPPQPNSEPEVKGIEWRRSDASVLVVRLQLWIIGLLTWFRLETPEEYAAAVQGMKRYVLTGELALDDFKQSKSLAKEVPPDDPKRRRKDTEYYSVRVKKDGTPFPLPPHVAIAKKLRERGEEVHVGTRIEYYVKDGAATPQVVQHVSDYANDVDRYHLWEDQVWPPTERLLAAAFPDYDWAPYGRARPKKERAAAKKTGTLFAPTEAPTAPAVPARKRKVNEAQADLFARATFGGVEMPNAPVVLTVVAPPPAPPSPVSERVLAQAEQAMAQAVLGPLATPPAQRRAPQALRVVIAEGAATTAVREVKDTLERYPGRRPVVVLVRLRVAEGFLTAPQRVADCPELRRDLARIPGVTVENPVALVPPAAG